MISTSQCICSSLPVSQLPLLPTRNAALQSLCRELFCHAYSEQTQLFLLPALAHAGPNEFPVVFLLPALVPFSLGSARIATVGEGVHPEAWELTVEASPWLLWAVLVLLEKQLSKCLVTHVHAHVKAAFTIYLTHRESDSLIKSCSAWIV